MATSGCGPVCASMIVETLTGQAFPPEQAAALAIEQGARVSTGTDMRTLADALFWKFGLKVTRTDSVGVLQAALEQGCAAIVNVGGDRAGYKGVFSDGGHYLVVFGQAADGRLVLADPYLYAGKYDKSYRQAVEVVGDLLYATPEVVDEDAENRSPRYTIFGA